MTLASSIRAVTFGTVLAGMASLGAREASAWPWPVVNPEIYNSGQQITGGYYNPFTGRFVVRTDRTRVRESVLDPWRNQADPGSKQYVDYVQVDANGVSWRVRGWKWTSNGVPHGNLQRTRVGSTGIPGVDHEQNDRMLYSYRPGKNKSKNQIPGVSVDSGEPRQSAPQPPGSNQPQGGYNPF